MKYKIKGLKEKKKEEEEEELKKMSTLICAFFERPQSGKYQVT